jgi:hypothetical protein
MNMSLNQYSEEKGERWYLGHALENWQDRVKIVSPSHEDDVIMPAEEWMIYYSDIEDINDELFLFLGSFNSEDGFRYGAFFLDVKRNQNMSEGQLTELLKDYGFLREEIENVLGLFPEHYLN